MFTTPVKRREHSCGVLTRFSDLEALKLRAMVFERTEHGSMKNSEILGSTGPSERAPRLMGA